MKRIIFMLLFIISYCINTYAEHSDTLVFDEVQLKVEISIPNITHINHDREGNLWITTLDGVYRYDGYDMIKYISNENESHGLIKNKTLRTHLSSDSTIWIASEYSIYNFNSETDRIIRKSETARNNHIDLYDISYFDIEDIDNHTMAIATKTGLRIYDKSSQEMISHDRLTDSFIHDNYSTSAHIVQMEKDPLQPHILWLLTRSGLYTFDCNTRTSTLRYYDKSVDFEKLRDRGFSLVPKGDQVYFLVNFLSLYRFDITTGKCTKLPHHFQNPRSNHIRNILPHDDGIIIVYIGNDLCLYNDQNNTIKSLANVYEDGTSSSGFSAMGFDHEGRYTFISNLTKLVKSVEKIKNTSYSQKIFTKNLNIEGYPVVDSMPSSSAQTLESYQRNIKIDIGLTNRGLNDEEQYFYRLDEDDDWIPLVTNEIKLSSLSAGNHEIYARIDSDGNTFQSLVKEFNIKPYFYETSWFLFLIILSLTGVISIISYLVNIRKKDSKAYENKMLELEMSALRSQMNPHFLFNSINSIKSFVISREKEEAADYLTQFAKLIRMILENSRKKYLALEEEIEMLTLYIEMEQKRLNFSFEYDITIDSDVDPNFQIAPMLIQPYIENAIWHGLMNKYGDKKLDLHVSSCETGVVCVIRDNGIGREAADELQKKNRTSKKSLGLKITEDRIDIIRKLYKIETRIEIKDLYDKNKKPTGTEVKIMLPRINKHTLHD